MRTGFPATVAVAVAPRAVIGIVRLAPGAVAARGFLDLPCGFLNIPRRCPDTLQDKTFHIMLFDELLVAGR